IWALMTRGPRVRPSHGQPGLWDSGHLPPFGWEEAGAIPSPVRRRSGAFTRPSMKIARAGEDADVTRVAGSAGAGMGAVAIGQAVKLSRAVVHAGRHQMHVAFLAALNLAFHQHQAGRHDRAALHFEEARPKQDIGDAGFILDGDENGIALAGTLADQHDTGD